jgi:hypothetical protein
MLDKIFKLIQRWAASSERDRLDDKFLRLDSKVDHLDGRIDKLEMSQAAQSEKLSAIHSVTLANNEALEQKLNRNSVTTEGVRQIVDARMETFQVNLKHIQTLIEKIVNRDVGGL